MSIVSRETIAFDLVGSASRNLTAFMTDAPVFGNPGDVFGITDVATAPFAVIDDSAGVFPPDTLGVIDSATNTDTFFAMVDTINGDNPTDQPYTATWSFDISGYANLSLSLDMGAMGDFESSDVFDIAYAIDGGAAQTLFSVRADEAASQTYTLAGGAVITLDDPFVEQTTGTVLSNVLQTFSADLAGAGSTLTLTAVGSGDGGSEAIAVQNIVVEGVGAPMREVIAFDLVGSASRRPRPRS
jgi:hypothetical protein